MKKLQNNFTTPEQSKRLLELGVPAKSADCYFYDWDLKDADIYSRGGAPQIFDCFERDIEKFEARKCIEMYPCWSVGRLMEIFEICDVMTEETRSNICCIPSLKRMSYMKYMMKCFTKAIEMKALDFSKLEE